MAYSELIKDFGRIRAYLRSFYVYGFQHREEFTQKSARGYDNERRRVESWLGDYIFFKRLRFSPSDRCALTYPSPGVCGADLPSDGLVAWRC